MTSTETPIPSLAPQPEALARLFGRLLTVAVERRGEGLAVRELASGRYVHVNDVLLRWMGRGRDDVIDRTDAEIFDAATAGALRAAEQSALAGEGLRSEHRLEWAGVRREYCVVRTVSAPDADGRRWVLSLWCDRTPEVQREAQFQQALAQLEQQQRANDALRRELADQGLRDAASGLYAHAHFEDQLRREVDLSTREHREFAIVLGEIDALGEAVREAGPAGENTVLAAVGRLLRGGTRAMDCACRLDDRRFAVLLSGVGLATAHSRMEGLRRRCATEIVVHEGRDLGFTVSMGVASYPHTAQSQADLVAACESALAESRRRGGNHVTLAAIRLDAG